MRELYHDITRVIDHCNHYAAKAQDEMFRVGFVYQRMHNESPGYSGDHPSLWLVVGGVVILVAGVSAFICGYNKIQKRLAERTAKLPAAEGSIDTLTEDDVFRT